MHIIFINKTGLHDKVGSVIKFDNFYKNIDYAIFRFLNDGISWISDNTFFVWINYIKDIHYSDINIVE